MTGRTAGYCRGSASPGFANMPERGFAVGFGRNCRQGFGFGGGRGRRNMFQTTGMPGRMNFGTAGAAQAEQDPERERSILKSEGAALQAELDRIKSRLAALETGPTTE